MVSSLWECWWLLFSATFQEGQINHYTNQVTTVYDEVGTNKKVKGDAVGHDLEAQSN